MDLQETKNSIVNTTGIRYLIVSVFLALLCFFILLNNIASINQQKAEEMMLALKKEFLNKDLAEEFRIYDRREYDKGIGEHPQTFHDLLNIFTEIEKQKLTATISQTPSQYILKIDMTSFFGPGSDDVRSTASAYLTDLNNYILLNRKSNTAQAMVVLNYRDTKTGLSHAEAKLKSMHAALDDANIRAVTFSMMPTTNSNNTNYIFIAFNKNEF